MKVQERYILKYLNLRICQSPLGFSVDQTYHITELVNEYSPTVKFIRVDTTFRTDFKYEKELINALPLTRHALNKAETDYQHHGKFGHTIGRIQHINIMSRIGICYAKCRLETQYVAPNITGFQGIKLCVQYPDSYPYKPIFYHYSSYDVSNVIRLI